MIDMRIRGKGMGEGIVVDIMRVIENMISTITETGKIDQEA